jgi:phosphopantetheine--protein transferase-like protein
VDLPESVPPSGLEYVVGVDVVDVTAPRTRDRAADTRFLDRVFTGEERERIQASPLRDRMLWTLWAAKEAAFKVVSKLHGAPPVFRHADFQVMGPPDEPVRRVLHKASQIQVEVGVEADDRRVLVWAWDGRTPEILVARASVEDALALLGLGSNRQEWEASALRPEELESVHSLSSALVRLMARRDAARMLGAPEGELTVVCSPGDPGRRLPFVYRVGRHAPEVDISLSHDSGELAWAIRRRGPHQG